MRRAGRAGAATAAPSRRGLAAPVGLGSIASASQVALLATSAWLITRASLRPPILLLAVAIGAVQAFALARGLARYAERLAVHDRSLRVLAALRLRLFDRLEPLVPGGLPGHGSGSLLGAFVSDTEAVAEALARRLAARIDAAASTAAGVALALVLDPPAAAVLAGGAAAIAASSATTGRALRRLAGAQAAARAELYEVVLAAIATAPELVAYGREDLVGTLVAEAGARAEAPARRAAAVTGAGRAAALLAAGATLLGVLAVGFAAHGAGRLSGVLLAVVALASLALLETLVGLPEAHAAVAHGAAATARLATLEGRPPPAPEPGRPAPAPPRPAALGLEAAVVAREGAVVLDGVSLAVPPGRRIGLAGPSGSGKSTAVLTLLHFLECRSGRAALGGVDVAGLARADLGRRVGWVPEAPHVFCGTLGANLRVADPGASDAACKEALERVGLGAFLAGLPEGLETRLGATGRATSAGERQRLCLARALLTDPDVLLLDEPTAHLDPNGARRALGELVASTGTRGLLVVSHDEEALDRLDAVAVLPPPGTPPGSRPRSTQGEAAAGPSACGAALSGRRPRRPSRRRGRRRRGGRRAAP